MLAIVLQDVIRPRCLVLHAENSISTFKLQHQAKSTVLLTKKQEVNVQNWHSPTHTVEDSNLDSGSLEAELKNTRQRKKRGVVDLTSGKMKK